MAKIPLPQHAGNPSWDVGTTIKPYCAQKMIFANDDYAYTLNRQACNHTCIKQ